VTLEPANAIREDELIWGDLRRVRSSLALTLSG
jgi:hypothetical protein